MRARIAVLAAALVGVVVLGACHSVDRPNNSHRAVATTAAARSSAAAMPTVTPGAATAVDASFVRTLSTLGAQGVVMAGYLPGRSAHAQLSSLVPAIEQHDPQLAAMREWLAHWAKSGVVPATPTGISDAALQAMAAMRGTAFDDSWLEHMGANYEAAIAACMYEWTHGVDPQARRWADDWLGWMRAQYEQMRQWHAGWMHDGRFPMMTTPSMPVRGSTGSPYPRYSDMPHMSSVPNTARPSMPHMTSAPMHR